MSAENGWRDCNLGVVVSDEERDLIDRAAEEVGQKSRSAFLRRAAMQRVRRILAHEDREAVEAVS